MMAATGSTGRPSSPRIAQPAPGGPIRPTLWIPVAGLTRIDAPIRNADPVDAGAIYRSILDAHTPEKTIRSLPVVASAGSC